MAVTKLQEVYIEQKAKLEEAINNEKSGNKINEQNNKMQDVVQTQEQGQ